MSSSTVTTDLLTTPTTPKFIDDENYGLSSGSVFCIIFLVVSLIYFGGGILIRKFIRGAEGHEMIPHYEFWSGLPGLMRDGFLFTINGCRPEVSYERI